jgi:hypothetical protein
MSETEQVQPPVAGGEVATGILLVIVGHLALGLFTMGMGLLFIGPAQLIYVVPIAIWGRGRPRRGVVQGAIIAAALTFLVNATCWGLFLGGAMGRIGG